MAGWVLLTFVFTLILLRALAVPDAQLFRGAAFMGFGIWLIWVTAVPHYGAGFREMPEIFPLFLGLWLVVKGALRVAS